MSQFKVNWKERQWGNILISDSIHDEGNVEKQLQSIKDIKGSKKGYQLDGRLKILTGVDAASMIHEKYKR
ncbi:hypothetical protein ACT7DL_30380 [Bacillus paranthracis]